jgi:pimeloyl-ACP methyl ester carboxylesterase
MTSALLLLAISPNNALAAGTPIPRSKLFVFLQGIDSFLTSDQAATNGRDGSDPDFFGTGTGLFKHIHLGTYLQSQGYSNARYLEYSYAPLGFTDTGQPQPYTCQDTYDYTLATHSIGLSRQIHAAVQNNPNTDIYLIGHSMGGIVAFGYLASLLEHVGNAVPLPRNGSMLKGIVTLDSPLGGITSNIDYKKLIFLRSLACEKLDAWNTVAVAQMQALFQTATSSKARGTTASVVKTILNGRSIPNQKVANDARRAGIPVLTIGNTDDLLWRPSVCNKTFKVNMQDFSSTQWLQDKGNNSRIYSRMFTSGFQNCVLGLLNLANHSDVFDTLEVEQAVAQIVNGTTPSTLLPAPLSA